MATSLIVIIPTLIAYCYAVFNAKSHEEKIEMVILFFAMCSLWIHFFAQSVKWFEPVFPTWLSILRAYTSSLAQPLAFMVVIQAIGRKHFSIDTVVLFSFVLINIIQYGAFSIDTATSTEKVDLNNICFLYGGKVFYRIPNYCVAMVLQSIWIFCRTWTLNDMIRRHNYHSTNEAKVVMKLLFLMIISVMVCATLPDGFWKSYITRYGFFIYFAIGFTVLLILIGKNFVLTPILDSNNEPVYLDRKPRFDELEKKCRELYDIEKIYLVPSLRLEDLAQRLGTNRTYAAELMKTHFGSTFAAYTNARRVEVAKKEIMAHPDDKLEDIAEMCGFATAPTFTKVFKAATGYTPSGWLAMQNKEGENTEARNI